MTTDIHPEATNGLRYLPAKRAKTMRTLAREDIRKLNRDLRIMIATNGTLPRILNVLADDESVVEIVNQQIVNGAAMMPEMEQLPGGRVLQRNILLKGRNSG